MSQEQLYSNVLVKVGAERSHLLKKEKLEKLTDSRTLAEFASELRETIYGQNLAEATLPYNSRNFERVFRENLIEVVIKMVRSSPQIVSLFLKTYILRFQHENIKTILRATSVGLSYDEIISRMHLTIEKFLKMQEVIMKAAMAIHVKSVVEVLRTTIYGPSLTDGLQKYEETGSTKYFDILLDRLFYENLAERFNGLPEKEQEYAYFYVSRETDMFNILTILRAKLLGYEPHWIRMAISRNFYNVPKKTIESMLMAGDFESALNIVRQSYYKKFFAKVETPEETISSAEKALRKDMLDYVKKTKIGDPFNIGTPMAFIMEKEIELYNLTAISLGIDYNWKKDDISGLLLL